MSTTSSEDESPAIINTSLIQSRLRSCSVIPVETVCRINDIEHKSWYLSGKNIDMTTLIKPSRPNMDKREDNYLGPASKSRTLLLGFSASLRATTGPAVPPNIYVKLSSKYFFFEKSETDRRRLKSHRWHQREGRRCFQISRRLAQKEVRAAKWKLGWEPFLAEF